MKLINISNDEQKVYPNFGEPFACLPAVVTGDIHPHVAADLVASFPKIWAVTDGQLVQPEIKSAEDLNNGQ